MSALEEVPNVDLPLVIELNKRWAAAGVLFGDLYSAVCRPGSWEYHLAAAARLRELLQQNGYVAAPDPNATWRQVWTRIDNNNEGANE